MQRLPARRLGHRVSLPTDRDIDRCVDREHFDEGLLVERQNRGKKGKSLGTVAVDSAFDLGFGSASGS
jgi:hypothetical protein